MLLLLLASIQAGDLETLLLRLKSGAAGERIAAAKELENLVWRPPEGRPFSDKPVDRPTPPPKLAPPDYDRAVAALGESANDVDAKVREAAAEALAGVYGDRPAVKASLVRALESKDPTVAWYVHQSFLYVRPTFEDVWPALRVFLDVPDETGRLAARSTLALYGPAARAAVPDLLRQAEVAAWSLGRIGVDHEQAKKLSGLDIPRSFNVFVVLLPHPDVAADYLGKSPKILERAMLEPEALFRVLEGVDTPLRALLLNRSDLPPIFLAWSREPRFRTSLVERAAKAIGHPKALLAACARACGEPAQQTIKIGEFRPRSAHPDTDETRMSKESGHLDGYTAVLITGRLRMTDGTPSAEPRFFNENDRMLMGIKRDEPGPLRYDPTTGRFIFFTKVFAAYATGKEGDLGPYQTGSAQVRVEAPGAKPLVVRFYDEMPDVEITLSPATK
ncbi:MAG TPA: hypothetical protein VF950_03860 [Planctomycetota bacterium]